MRALGINRSKSSVIARCSAFCVLTRIGDRNREEILKEQKEERGREREREKREREREREREVVRRIKNVLLLARSYMSG